jgi:hypothetical protein
VGDDVTIRLKRLDFFKFDVPLLQQGSTIAKKSMEMRKTKGWVPTHSIFVFDQATDLTMEMIIEAAAPPRRSRYRPTGKKNHRDLADWTLREKLFVFPGAEGIPGTKDMFIDWADTPDRYQIGEEQDAALGWRRLFRFAAYPATQYYILGKMVYNDVLEAEGGRGMTYVLEAGPVLFGQKDWRLLGSFYGFDRPLKSANKYTVYYREDPFPRTLIALGPITHAEEWNVKFVFYAFDMPVPGTSLYSLQHCIRSIHSTAASVSRHRLTLEDALMPWEFRMNIYVFPASLAECSFTLEPPPMTEEEMAEEAAFV